MSPAPSTLRAGATVLGYDSAGKLVTLRKGTNDLICLADDPHRKNFHVSCYFKALEPFMARGRELRAKGLSSDSADSIRAHEIRDGKLSMPKTPTALYQYGAPRDQVSDWGVRGALLGFAPRRRTDQSSKREAPCVDAPRSGVPGNRGRTS